MRCSLQLSDSKRFDRCIRGKEFNRTLEVGMCYYSKVSHESQDIGKAGIIQRKCAQMPQKQK